MATVLKQCHYTPNIDCSMLEMWDIQANFHDYRKTHNLAMLCCAGDTASSVVSILIGTGEILCMIGSKVNFVSSDISQSRKICSNIISNRHSTCLRALAIPRAAITAKNPVLCERSPSPRKVAMQRGHTGSKENNGDN